MSRRLIEEWLPIAELSEESVRERRSMTALPPIYYLHVWWARRPLVAARAAVLASLLPADADKERFLHALGIHGDPVAARRRIDRAKRTGARFKGQAYDYARAFSYLPNSEEKEWIQYELGRLSLKNPSLLDPTAGGGSIPFESLRLGIRTFANDLNPVSSFIQKCTYEIQLKFGVDILLEYRRICERFLKRREALLNPFFPREEDPDSVATNYLFARTIRCPYCGGLIPLSPNWRLAPDGTGVRVIPHEAADEAERVCTFEIVHKAREQSEGTVAGGRATCPFPDCGRVIDGDAVKGIAQAGGMGEQLYAVVYKRRVQTTTKSGKPGREKWVRGYRAPRPEDDVFATVEAKLAEKLPYWEAQDMVPTEAVPSDINDDRPIQYGMPLWRNLFSPRQLYCHCTSVEVFRELLAEDQGKKSFGEVQKAAFAYLALALDKLLNYNSRMSVWMPTREVVANTFNRHDFAFCWSHAEMAPLVAGMGYDWALEQTGKCLTELIGLLRPDIDTKSLKKGVSANSLWPSAPFVPPPVTITCKSGDNLDHIPDQSIDAVVMDPPYYDNVMYAELSDFFYVWLKRTAGYVYPQLFTRKLTNKENEAVANPAKFKGQKKPRDLAFSDYRTRMAAIFAECRRVLKADGVLMLMFTHKATGAWDALTKGLMDAGFVISASWPVNTEAEGSLHIKDKAAANSTIFLVCRPRGAGATGEVVFWEDLEPEVTRAVLERVESFRKAGISGIDLYLACFGPALEIFSRHWPVKRGTPRQKPKAKPGTQADLLAPEFDPYLTTPEDVLTTARMAVKGWIIRQIVQSGRQTQLDPLLEWFVLAWHTFRAPQFAYDEALNLARVVGLDLDRDIIGIVAGKKGSDVVLWDSATRAARASLGASGGTRSTLDALHHAAHAARSRSLEVASELLRQHGLDKSPEFMDGLKALLEVLPVSRSFGGNEGADMSAASDFEALENLRRLLFAEKVKAPQQLSLFETTP